MEHRTGSLISRLRWIVPSLIALGVLAGLGWTWLVYDELRQHQYIFSLVIAGGGAILAFVWTLLTSQSRVTRALCLLGALAVGVLLAVYRVEAVSGDLLPRFVVRWAPRADSVLPSLPEGLQPDEDGASSVANPIELEPTPLDYPRFLGREGLAIAPSGGERRLARDWANSPPRLQWRQEIGAAWSSFAVAGDFAFTQEQRGADECVVAYHWRSGDVVWSRAEHIRYDTVIAGVGPRATPSVVGARVYAQGATGILVALDATSGETIWRRDTLADSGGSNQEWGTSGSPLVLEDIDIVIVTGTASDGALLAYDISSGEPVWQSGPGPSSYASPERRTIAGREQILALHHHHVAGHDPSTGEVLWSHDWPGNFPKVPQPVVVGEARVLVSSGYGVGAELLELRSTATPYGASLVAHSVWKNSRLKSKFANFVVQDGTVYGLDDGIFCALDLETGERLWKGGRYGHGQVLQVDELLLVSTESGDIVLVEPSREALRELTRFHAIDGMTWNHPVLIGRHLLVRNSREAACWELPARDAP